MYHIESSTFYRRDGTLTCKILEDHLKASITVSLKLFTRVVIFLCLFGNLILLYALGR